MNRKYKRSNAIGSLIKFVIVVGILVGIGSCTIPLLQHEEKPSTTYTYSSNSSSSYESFTNKYGTRTTKCAHSGCTNYIAKSGDTNCCVTHSRRCANCNCYIDEDAIYCMDCLKKALS